MPQRQIRKYQPQRIYSSDESLNSIPDLDDVEAEPLDDLQNQRDNNEIEDEIMNEIPDLDDDPDMVFL